MSHKIKTKPEIRFSGYTDDWEQRKLGEISKVTTGFPFKNSDFVDEGQYLVITNGNVKSDSSFIDSSIGNYITNVSSEVKNKYLLNKGDILITMDGTVGRSAKVIKENQILAQRVGRLIAKEDGEFLYHWLNTGQFYYEMTKLSHGGTIKHISLSEISDYRAMMPDVDEQQKIGTFFKQLDDTIDLHQRQLEALEKTKKSFLQKMFPKKDETKPEIRFAGFTDDWEQRKLGETKTFFTDGNYGELYPSAKDLSDKLNGIPFLRGSDFKNGYLDSTNCNYITYQKHLELKTGHIEKDDIIMAVRGSLGALGYATIDNVGWNINSQLAILRTDKSEIYGRFLSQFLISYRGQKEILSRNTGTALKQLPIKQIKEIPVPIINIEEQQKIGTFFKQLDDTIALHQRQLEALETKKKSFLQKMFV